MRATIVFPGTCFIKKLIVKTCFFVLGRSLQSASYFDATIRKEISRWREGYSIKMEVLPKGPVMTLKKEGGKLRYMGKKIQEADLVIRFKNLTSAFILMTPQIGIAQGFAQHRISVAGDLSDSIVFTRILNILMAYLYPSFISRKLLKEIPPLPYRKYYRRVYLYMIGILFGK